MSYHVAEHGLHQSYVVDVTTGERVEEFAGPGKEELATADAHARNMAAVKLAERKFAGKYEEKGREIGALVDRKQREYGDSRGKSAAILRALYPDGIRPDQYHDVLGVARVIDKLSRIANGNQGEENAWADLAGYGLLGTMDGRKE